MSTYEYDEPLNADYMRAHEEALERKGLLPSGVQETLDRLNEGYQRLGPGRASQWGFDPERKMYFSTSVNGQKQFQANTGMPGAADQTPKDTTGMFRSRPQFNQKTGKWDTPIDWSNILSVGTGAAMGVGALSAAGAFGGAGAGGGSGAAAGGSGAGAGLAGASTVAETIVPASAYTGAMGAPAAAAGAGAGAAGAKSALIAGAASRVLDGIGSGAGAAADSMAGNRGARVDAEFLREGLDQTRRARFFDQMLARDQNRRESGKDALAGMTRATAIANRKDYVPAMVGGKALPTFGIGPKAATADEITGANAYKAEQMKRLQHGDSLLPAPIDPGKYEVDPDLLRASNAERGLDWVGAGATVASKIPASAWKRVWEWIV